MVIFSGLFDMTPRRSRDLEGVPRLHKRPAEEPANQVSFLVYSFCRHKLLISFGGSSPLPAPWSDDKRFHRALSTQIHLLQTRVSAAFKYPCLESRVLFSSKWASENMLLALSGKSITFGLCQDVSMAALASVCLVCLLCELQHCYLSVDIISHNALL